MVRVDHGRRSRRGVHEARATVGSFAGIRRASNSSSRRSSVLHEDNVHSSHKRLYSHPMTDVLDIQRIDHESPYGRWTLLWRAPAPWLRPYVTGIEGYVEEGGAPVVRKELPS